MIINRVDLEGRVLNEEEYRLKFEKYVEERQQEMKGRISGIKSSLEKYQQFRFSTSAAKNQEVDLC
jgi:DNA-binding protein H-NS